MHFARVNARLQSLTPAKIVKHHSASLHSSPVPRYNVDLDMHPNVKLHIIFEKRRGFDPLSPESDQHQISSCNINAL